MLYPKKFIVIFIFFINSYYINAHSISSCYEPRPPSLSEINQLKNAIVAFDPMVKVNIKEILICDDSRYKQKTASVLLKPHIKTQYIKQKYSIKCSKENKNKLWQCDQKHLIKSYKDVTISHNISIDEVKDVFFFIKNLNADDFYDFTKNYNYTITKSSIKSYRKISSITKNDNKITIITPYGEYGCFLDLERIECGLDKCDFKVIFTGFPLCGGCVFIDKEHVTL